MPNGPGSHGLSEAKQAIKPSKPIGGFLIAKPSKPCEIADAGYLSGDLPLREATAVHKEIAELTGELGAIKGDCETQEFLRTIKVAPFGVLGSRQVSCGADIYTTEVVGAGSEPCSQTAVVDPASLHQILGKQLPQDAIGQSKLIYHWLGIDKPWMNCFPEDVKSGIQTVLDAKCHAYGAKNVIHVASPHLQERKYNRDRAAVVRDLGTAYSNCLREFAHSGLQCLRLLPLSGQRPFCGPFASVMPDLTREALLEGFRQLDHKQKRHILKSSCVELCIFDEHDYEVFLAAFDSSTDSDASTRSGSGAGPGSDRFSTKSCSGASNSSFSLNTPQPEEAAPCRLSRGGSCLGLEPPPQPDLVAGSSKNSRIKRIKQELLKKHDNQDQASLFSRFSSSMRRASETPRKGADEIPAPCHVDCDPSPKPESFTDFYNSAEKRAFYGDF